MQNTKKNKIIIYTSAFIILVLITFGILRDNSKLIPLDKLEILLQTSKIEKVVISSDYVYLKTQKELFKIATTQTTPKMFQHLNVETKNNQNLLLYILIFIVLVEFISIIFRWYQKEKVTKKSTNLSPSQEDGIAHVTVVEALKSDISFNDIGGISDVKVEIQEIIDFMKNPQRYKKFGAYMPRGVLLVGPPGVGKTMIAKAMAHEAGVPFFYQSGASFVQIYVGMGAKRVHELFLAAKNNAPSIIFIDEIDAVGKKRDGQRNDEREATLNQLLTEMDGYEDSSGVIVVAATNKIDILDSALLRAGRFDRRIFVQLPTKEEREAILSKYLQKVPHNLDINIVANMTVGFNGASLAALVNEAALLSLRENDNFVTLEHFDLVKDKVMFGKKKLQILTAEQKKYRITYQAAKVVSATYFDLPFEKIMLSHTKLLPSTDEPLIKYELEARVKMLLSGIVTCDIKYNQHSSNVESDLEDAKKLIENMVKKYGMGNTLIAQKREDENYIQKLYEETKTLINSFDSIIIKVENILYEKESITKVEVKRYLDEIL